MKNIVVLIIFTSLFFLILNKTEKEKKKFLKSSMENNSKTENMVNSKIKLTTSTEIESGSNLGSTTDSTTDQDMIEFNKDKELADQLF